MRSDPWLTDEQQRVWRTFLRMWGELDDRIERDMQQTGRMPHAYYLILAILSEAPERRLRMNQLAATLRSSQSRVSHAVTRLEEAGWVRREPSTEDRRGQIATLTDDGYDRLVQVAPSHAETVRSTMFDPLTAEQTQQLKIICETILAGMHAEQVTADPDDDAPR